MRTYGRIAVWACLLGLIGLWLAGKIRQDGVIRTDLLSLLPRESQQPSAEAALDHLSKAGGNRAFLLVTARTQEEASKASALVADRLRASGSFRYVLHKVPPPDLKEVLGFFGQTPTALPPAGRTLREAFLERCYGAFSTTGTLSLSADPFGSSSDWVRQIPWPQAQLKWDDGLLVARTGQGESAVLIITEPSGPAGDFSVQQHVVRGIDEAEKALRAQHPDSRVLRMGGIFYAESAQRSARTDTDRISIGSIIGVVLIMLLFFRSFAMLLCGGVSIAAGVLAGAAGVVLVFGEIHLITLVFGVSLIGEAADYSIQLVSARLSADESNDGDWLPKVLPGLWMALATSLLGYAAMTFVPLPAIRQIAVFALVGLTSAFLSVLLLGPASVRLLRGGRVAPVFGWLATGLIKLGSKLGRASVTMVVVFTIGGLLLAARTDVEDDVRSLIQRPSELMAQEAAVKKALGAGLSTQFILINPQGGSDEACLKTQESLRSKLRKCREKGALVSWTMMADIIPSAERQKSLHEEHLMKLKAEDAALRAAFTEVGFKPAPHHAQPAFTPLSVENFLRLNASHPFRHLRFTHAGKICHVITLAEVTDPTMLRAEVAGAQGCLLVDKPAAVSELLGDVRRLGVIWLACAVTLTYGILLLRYGASRAALMILPTLAGLTWAPVLGATMGVPFTVFSLMALLLVLGVGVNYAIFLWEGGTRSRAALAGVIASSLTTLLSFGLLAFCSMPALAWLGVTLSFGILLALVLTPLALAEPGKKASSSLQDKDSMRTESR
jgi:predicted exporter